MTFTLRWLKPSAYILAAFFCAAVLVATPGLAATITPTGGTSGGNPGGQPLFEVSGLVEGDVFNVSWGGVSGLAVEGMVFVDSLTSSTADIRIMLDNNSTPISGDDPRVTSVGMAIENYTSLASSSAGGTYLDGADDSNFPGFTVDACGTSGNNCAGGGNGGIPAGDSDDLTLEINGNFGIVPTLTLSEFALKIQGGPSGNSFELAGLPTPKPDPDGGIPEPATYVLMLGSLGVLAVRKRWA